ncbi:MAG: hypothetical protein FWD91_02600, partial [Treponema sp.]|nr:hypothetical protein [Treponema sp.]
LSSLGDSCRQGEFILSRWKPYYAFLERIQGNLTSGETATSQNAPVSHDAPLSQEAADSCQLAIKRFVFSRALDCFVRLAEDTASQKDPVLLFQIGRCCKGAGNWGEALKYLELAGQLRREDSAILSELADVNALLGDDRAAKALFREAFFLEPQDVNLAGLESEVILQLANGVRKLGHSGGELAEWIPVWGCIWGIFSVKRELKPVELGRLKQSIFALENEYRSKSASQPLVKPRLLNRYFWLIDHYDHSKDVSGLDETVLKIQVIDPAIYEQYSNREF